MQGKLYRTTKPAESTGIDANHEQLPGHDRARSSHSDRHSGEEGHHIRSDVAKGLGRHRESFQCPKESSLLTQQDSWKPFRPSKTSLNLDITCHGIASLMNSHRLRIARFRQPVTLQAVLLISEAGVLSFVEAEVVFGQVRHVV